MVYSSQKNESDGCFGYSMSLSWCYPNFWEYNNGKKNYEFWDSKNFDNGNWCSTYPYIIMVLNGPN